MNCVYNKVTYTCEDDPDYETPHKPFEMFVWLVMAINVCKELAKLGCLLYYLYHGSIPLHFRAFVASSVLAPLYILGGRAKFMREVVCHEPTKTEDAWAFLYEGVCEDFIAFPLGLYYATSVITVGLDSSEYLSLLVSAGLTCKYRVGCP